MNLIGVQLDSKYRVLRALGSGGFGQVYLAEDELLGRRVAIKLLRDRDSEAHANLVHEMRSLDRLHHPNVVAFYHHFINEETLFLAMEYCAGGSLRDLMQRSPRLQTVMQWGRALAETLHYIHQHGIVHHDIKPDNILFTSEDVVKIGDFGVANRNIGTFSYVAPEMLLGDVDPNDVRIDVYALGVTLLEVVQTRSLFEGMSRREILRAKLQHDFLPTTIPRWLQDVLSKATHPTPELRFQTMQEFQEAIESQHVNYAFDRSRVQANALAAQAHKLLSKKRPTAAVKLITQALYVCPDCLSALIVAGQHSLYLNRPSEARQYFDRALSLNPRTNIQRELGWLCLENGNYSQAISLLSDHLQRNAADYEAFNLLLECFFRTERYDVGRQIATLMIEERAPSDCFENNAFICHMLQRDSTDQEAVLSALQKRKVKGPFLTYNLQVFSNGAQDRRQSLALFEGYRFGLSQRKQNIVTIEHSGKKLEFSDPIITIGRSEENRFCLADTNVSRNHCVILNFFGDVWIYDLNSTQGVFVDGVQIDRKAYLQGVHIARLGESDLTISPSPDILL